VRKRKRSPSVIPYLSQRGLGQVLGDLEREVMATLWTMECPTSGREVYEHLSRKGDWAYTTILTVVNRLVEKGLIKRRKRGGMWSFEPAISQDEFRAMVSREAVQRALELAPEATITQLVDLLAEREPTVLDELARLVERARAEREEEG
jgi:predicted transcriptional regulator